MTETDNSSQWETDTSGFIDALEHNEYAEYPLDEHHTLITDMDSPPYVHVPNEHYQSHEHIVQLCENNILDIFTWDDGEVYTQGNSTYYAFYGIRATY